MVEALPNASPVSGGPYRPLHDEAARSFEDTDLYFTPAMIVPRGPGALKLPPRPEATVPVVPAAAPVSAPVSAAASRLSPQAKAFTYDPIVQRPVLPSFGACNTLYLGNIPTRYVQAVFDLLGLPQADPNVKLQPKGSAWMLWVKYQSVSSAEEAIELVNSWRSPDSRYKPRAEFAKNPLGVTTDKNPARRPPPNAPRGPTPKRG